MSLRIDVESIKKPTNNGTAHAIQGIFHYYHYRCDGIKDEGWGCGYRTLQSICSWMRCNVDSHNDTEIPTIDSIQRTLVRLEDKPKSFIASREWIGSVEVGLVIDELFNVPCKILHINSGKDLGSHIDTIRRHFVDNRCPIMMGGDIDCSSKSIIGVCEDDGDVYLLIVDPHCRRVPKSQTVLENDGWIKWFKLNDFICDSFYNLCMPQIKLINTDVIV